MVPDEEGYRIPNIRASYSNKTKHSPSLRSFRFDYLNNKFKKWLKDFIEITHYSIEMYPSGTDFKCPFLWEVRLLSLSWLVLFGIICSACLLLHCELFERLIHTWFSQKPQTESRFPEGPLNVCWMSGFIFIHWTRSESMKNEDTTNLYVIFIVEID